ncbi:MAG TPA: hypothetical protein VF006_12895 [Longimicrobium sp.]
MKRPREPEEPELVKLITRAKAGDDAAHRELYTRFKGRFPEIWRWFGNLDPHRIEEAFDDAFMAAVQNFRDGEGPFESLLGTAFWRRCLDQVKLQKRGLRLLRNEDDDDSDDDETSDEDLRRVRELIEEWLRPRLRSAFPAFCAHYLEGVAWKDLGPPGKRVQVSRLRSQIKRAIDRGEADELIKQVCERWCGKTCRFPTRCANSR